MSDLSSLSKAQLKKLIEAKKSESKEEPDYSHASQRDWGDTARDVAYGALKMPTHAITGALNMIPGMNSTANEQLENIKSPHPSAGGDMAQEIGSYLMPGALARRPALRALEHAFPITEGLAGRGYQRLNENMQQHTLPTGNITPELRRNIMQLFEHPSTEPARNTAANFLQEGMQAEPGNYTPIQQLSNLMGRLSRSGRYGQGEGQQANSIAMETEQQQLLDALRRNMGEAGLEREAAAHQRQGGIYRRHHALRRNIVEPIRRFAGPAAILKEIANLLHG